MSASGKTVLIIVENLPVPHDRRVWQESIALRDAGYTVLVICPQMLDQREPEVELEGIRIHRHPLEVQARGLLGFFAEYTLALWGETRLAWRLWRKHRFDVIHLCNPPDILFLVALPFRLLGVKVIYDVHDLWPEMFEAKFGGRKPLYWCVRLAERLTYAAADVVLATNESVRRIAAGRGGKRIDQVFVVRTAPKIRQGDYQPDPALKKGKRFLVGYVGVMGSADGLERLIHAAHFLVNTLGRSDVQFLLMGTGPEFESLVALRDSLGLRDIIDMPGWVNGPPLFRALKTIDLGVSCDPPNAYNNHCTMNKHLEYMAFGKAQVMFDLVEGRASAADAALYVSGEKPEELATAIGGLLDDPEKRDRMGQAGYARLTSELSWEQSVTQLTKAYAKISR